MLRTLNSDVPEGPITYSDYSKYLPNIYYVPGITLSVLTHLMLTTTFRGRYYSHFHFTKLREVSNWPKITQLVNGVAQIRTPAFWLQNLHLANQSHCLLLFIKQDIDSFRCICYVARENYCLRRETSWTKGLSVRIDVAKLWGENDAIALHARSRSAGSSAPLSPLGTQTSVSSGSRREGMAVAQHFLNASAQKSHVSFWTKLVNGPHLPARLLGNVSNG